MNNIPQVKVGIVAVSRDCFPESLSVNRRKALIDAYTKKFGATEIYECPVCIVESEIHMVQALEDVKNAGCNALVVYLGNFGPEISETLLAKHFDGPVMFCAAAEESAEDLMDGRGDAYCGMLNASYNLKLRNVKVYIPLRLKKTPSSTSLRRSISTRATRVSRRSSKTWKKSSARAT